ncbi:MAG: VCBS repeat-containing protein [Planctomycetes bacterium]|nr:VCBS repeat-containing protein [Planctomycetota bacterium]
MFRPLPAYVILLVFAIGIPVSAQEGDLANYFGFEGLEIIKIGRNAGPISYGDVNSDGLIDIIVVNNHASRIEIHYQKTGASPTDEPTANLRANEFPEHWRYRRENISVTHFVNAVLTHDFDGDGLVDLIYAGRPSEIVFVRQKEPGKFVITRRHRVKNLSANRSAFAIADVVDDRKPELLSLVDGEIHIWTIQGDNLSAPVELMAGAGAVAFFVEDFNGDGRLDIAGVLPEDSAPVRIWFGGYEGGKGTLGAQVRFEMPALRELEPLRLPGENAARIAVIERASKRIVLYKIEREQTQQSGDREADMRIYSFTDSGNRKRDHAVVDMDGDGLLDLIATDTEANTVVVYRQVKGKGIQPAETYPSLSEMDYLVAANVDDDSFAEMFVLSEKEGVVGRSDIGPHGVPFPRPINISEGKTPVALNLVTLESGPHIAVVAKSSRDYVLDLIAMDGTRQTVKIGKLSRSPETIIALDADQNGRTDLLLFTRDKPMIMLYAGEDGFELTESKDMGQYGMVKAATAKNTAVFDIDGDGREELLIADRNFVRAVRYEINPPAGVSPGWQVVEQINVRDSSSKLVSIALLGDRIVSADKENDRLVIMGRSERDGGAWREIESLYVRGFSFDTIHAGAFSGDGEDNILAVGDDGFAIIRLAGEHITLREFASWRTSDEQRYQHELAVGDVNSDGFVDIVSLDAGEQMCEIFTFSEAQRMLYATGFQVFESKIFSAGEPREFQPSQVLIADVTGDGANDLILLAHDRVLIYPQMREK